MPRCESTSSMIIEPEQCFICAVCSDILTLGHNYDGVYRYILTVGHMMVCMYAY